MPAMYDDFAKDFSQSRKNMKWGEIDYFLELVGSSKKSATLLDVGCGNGRLLESISENKIELKRYFGIDNSLGLLEEAKKLHPDNGFMLLDMQDIGKLPEKYDFIFFIASFHHLESIEDRENVLLSAYDLLNSGGTLCMTNWALESDINKKKYQKSKIEESENIFGSSDYSIKFGEFYRYYHCFSLKELQNISECSGFTIEENRLFENDKNFVTILSKK